MRYLVLVYLFIKMSLPLCGGRFRHVQREWNTTAQNLEGNAFHSMNSWHYLDWLGVYYQTEEWWIYHCDKGWLYPEGTSELGVWFYWQDKKSWVWTRKDIYPFAWHDTEDMWIDFCVKPNVVAQR